MVNSILGLVLGHSLVAMPLVLIIVLSALKNYDMNQLFYHLQCHLV